MCSWSKTESLQVCLALRLFLLISFDREVRVFLIRVDISDLVLPRPPFSSNLSESHFLQDTAQIPLP